MSDEYLSFDINGEKRKATPQNTNLFTFVGHLAMYDHIFHVVDEEKSIGAYVWKTAVGDETFMRCAAFMVNNGFMAILNQDRLPDCDKKAYDEMVDRRVHEELNDIEFPPDGWN